MNCLKANRCPLCGELLDESLTTSSFRMTCPICNVVFSREEFEVAEPDDQFLYLRMAQ